ncbi:DUF5819 family protein [Polaribacter cellanae]|uniref:Uncharacterized protein n=1 Tax=Polaribacter cellanae TaxID=2818493 RepID=A0A975CQ59_9FLAO|nr:DUF5819 family protein [Polaribacter cellanae]QTE21837.1 hypothetical protein J3359_13570 [Polaribacter cellanae]
MKKLKILIISVIVLHFLLISIGQLRDLGYINNSFAKHINDSYIIPYFEQSWSMFAPNPPKGNQYFVVKYKINNDSLTLDIHEQVRKGSVLSLFNINQRLLKYQNECYNDILRKLESKKISFSNINVSNSHGLESILNYSKIVLKKQLKFLSNIKSTDSIKVDIYLIDEPLNKPNSPNKYGEKKYIQLENIYLGKKDEL